MSPFVSAARTVAWRNLHNWFTNPALLLPSLLFPLFFFTAFAGGLSRVDSVPGFDYEAGYTTFVYGFVLLQAATFGGIFTGFSVAQDFESGFSRRLMLAAPRRSGIIAGYSLAAITRAGFTLSVITIVALIAGMNLNAGPLDLLAMYSLALVVSAAASLFGIGVAMRFRTMQAAPAMQTPAFLLLFLAPVWVPRALLSGWVESVADYNPMTAFLEAQRSFIAGNAHEAVLAFGLAAAAVALFVLWALRGLHSAEQVA
jgi:ABC-2 type transport system permease protein